MIKSNFHTHTTFCDGKNTAEEMILSAINEGLGEIGFSGHSPMDFECCWCMKREEVPEYIDTLRALREKYKDKIKVYIGIEQDYYSTTDTSDFDYVLGSVHYILKDGEYLPLDESLDKTKENIDIYYGGDAMAYCRDYYKLVGDVYEKTKCDIIGHFDLITKFNEKMRLIDTGCSEYVEMVSLALSSLLKSGAVFELNTGAISRGYRTSPYPEDYIIDMIDKAGGAFVVCSDSHNTGTVYSFCEENKKQLIKKGCTVFDELEAILKKTQG